MKKWTWTGQADQEVTLSTWARRFRMATPQRLAACEVLYPVANTVGLTPGQAKIVKRGIRRPDRPDPLEAGPRISRAGEPDQVPTETVFVGFQFKRDCSVGPPVGRIGPRTPREICRRAAALDARGLLRGEAGTGTRGANRKASPWNRPSRRLPGSPHRPSRAPRPGQGITARRTPCRDALPLFTR